MKRTEFVLGPLPLPLSWKRGEMVFHNRIEKESEGSTQKDREIGVLIVSLSIADVSLWNRNASLEHESNESHESHEWFMIVRLTEGDCTNLLRISFADESVWTRIARIYTDEIGAGSVRKVHYWVLLHQNGEQREVKRKWGCKPP